MDVIGAMVARDRLAVALVELEYGENRHRQHDIQKSFLLVNQQWGNHVVVDEEHYQEGNEDAP